MNRAAELNLDVSAEDARALHRVVRAMHDGHCPNCGYLGPAHAFEECRVVGEIDHVCPECGFSITHTEATAALAAFRPHLAKSLAVFEAWRSQAQSAT